MAYGEPSPSEARLKVAGSRRSKARHYGPNATRIFVVEYPADRAMPSVLPSSVADAKVAERKAWKRYAEARDDNWREALAEWVEARDALLAAYADEAASLHRF